MRNIRILIADDHPMMLTGIKSILCARPEYLVVGETDTGENALELCRTLHPDILIADISMPGVNGFEVADTLRTEGSETRVIILSMYDDREYVSQFAESGACAYVLKKNPPEELYTAITAVMRGEAYLSPSITRTILKDHRTETGTPHDRLTSRETEVLKLIALGRTSKEIADQLYVSIRTVAKYRESISRKLDLHSIADLTHYAISMKLVTLKGR